MTQQPAPITPDPALVQQQTGTPPADPPADPATTPPADQGDWKPPTREEWEASQKAIAAANQRARKLEQDAQRLADKEAEANGEYQQIAERERQRAEQLEQGIKATAIDNAILEAAQRLQFRNPLIAPALVSRDEIEATITDGHTAKVEAAGVQLIEQRLAAKLESDPYLKADAPRAQLAGAGNPGATGATGGNAAMNDAIRRGAGRGTL